MTRTWVHHFYYSSKFSRFRPVFGDIRRMKTLSVCWMIFKHCKIIKQSTLWSETKGTSIQKLVWNRLLDTTQKRNNLINVCIVYIAVSASTDKMIIFGFFSEKWHSLFAHEFRKSINYLLNSRENRAKFYENCTILYYDFWTTIIHFSQLIIYLFFEVNWNAFELVYFCFYETIHFRVNFVLFIC